MKEKNNKTTSLIKKKKIQGHDDQTQYEIRNWTLE